MTEKAARIDEDVALKASDVREANFDGANLTDCSLG